MALSGIAMQAVKVMLLTSTLQTSAVEQPITQDRNIHSTVKPWLCQSLFVSPWASDLPALYFLRFNLLIIM
jgi:hypothetical protein